MLRKHRQLMFCMYLAGPDHLICNLAYTLSLAYICKYGSDMIPIFHPYIEGSVYMAQKVDK